MKDERFEDFLINKMTIIYKYLIKIGASCEDAEDIVQDTICKVIEYVDSISIDDIYPWLFKVSLNRYYNLYNKKKKEKIGIDDRILNSLYSDGLIEEHVLNEELKSNVHKILGLLKESYRTLLIFKYFVGLSYKEIGEILDLDENKVKTYLYRARNKFKELWEVSNYGR
ncbi:MULTISPECIES: RNA polymerase sigma factor [Thermoanaerobacterium]|uniref:ECF subfamily RNA polymerase sigma-24 subunit n=2 Tax=Thermoanaerobacterium TaxID=28895 RepID=W9EFK2_9THEO|nr:MULTISPECIES: RNA polymerase sigma factor [Thermoanaerobacterium]AFK85293.1 RNA polymerase, sigma-24 subunit, ECF subfamily [Thermoanaerobacterium saccharolyticum JW/SL-YS485]ETO39790.1 ECF subfamily RNA polymerase sigma-24 subunit [Thermoanaerobacterium aotearoense SCUT27]